MSKDAGQLRARLNGVLALLLFPHQATGLVMPSSQQLEVMRDSLIESIRRLRAEIRTRLATLFASNDYEAAIREHDGVLNCFVATVRVPKRFVLPHHKNGVKSLFFHITLSLANCRRDLFVALPPILRAKYGGIKVAIRRKGGLEPAIIDDDGASD